MGDVLSIELRRHPTGIHSIEREHDNEEWILGSRPSMTHSLILDLINKSARKAVPIGLATPHDERTKIKN